MNSYNLKQVKEEAINWEQIESLSISEYPWYQSGLKQDTEVKVVLHEEKIKIKAFCKDIHSYSRETKLNGDVHLDSCFECFLTPWDQLGGPYFNIEINCCGVLHMKYRNGLGSKKIITEDQAKKIKIIPSIQAVIKDEMTDDSSWEIRLELPLHLLEEMSGKAIEDKIWYGNFYRCGGKTEGQYATWNSITWEKPNFHLPNQFGRLVLV